jgi:hypothetical protein
MLMQKSMHSFFKPLLSLNPMMNFIFIAFTLLVCRVSAVVYNCNTGSTCAGNGVTFGSTMYCCYGSDVMSYQGSGPGQCTCNGNGAPSCPNNCFNQGPCNNGVCNCPSWYQGADCSIVPQEHVNSQHHLTNNVPYQFDSSVFCAAGSYFGMKNLHVRSTTGNIPISVYNQQRICRGADYCNQQVPDLINNNASFIPAWSSSTTSAYVTNFDWIAPVSTEYYFTRHVSQGAGGATVYAQGLTLTISCATYPCDIAFDMQWACHFSPTLSHVLPTAVATYQAQPTYDHQCAAATCQQPRLLVSSYCSSAGIGLDHGTCRLMNTSYQFPSATISCLSSCVSAVPPPNNSPNGGTGANSAFSIASLSTVASIGLIVGRIA